MRRVDVRGTLRLMTFPFARRRFHRWRFLTASPADTFSRGSLFTRANALPGHSRVAWNLAESRADLINYEALRTFQVKLDYLQADQIPPARFSVAVIGGSPGVNSGGQSGGITVRTRCTRLFATASRSAAAPAPN